MPPSSHIKNMSFLSDQGMGTDARLGMIVLQSDQTIEHEVARIIYDKGVTSQIALYHSRIPNDTEVNEDTLRQMSKELPRRRAFCLKALHLMRLATAVLLVQR